MHPIANNYPLLTSVLVVKKRDTNHTNYFKLCYSLVMLYENYPECRRKNEQASQINIRLYSPLMVSCFTFLN
jgi:hypothetical protein